MSISETWIMKKNETQYYKVLAIHMGILVLGGDFIRYFSGLIGLFAPFFDLDPSKFFYPSLESGGPVLFFFRVVHNTLTAFECGRLYALFCVIVAQFICVSGMLLHGLPIRCSSTNKFKIHNWLTILETVTRDIVKLLAPFLILMSICIGVFSNYVVVRLYEINIFVYLYFCSLSIFVVVGIYFIVPNVCKLDENSRRFKREYAKKAIAREKYVRKLLRSIRPLRIHVASFGYFSRETKKEYYETMFTQTMNALLLN